MKSTRRRTARRIKPIRGRHYRWKVPLLKNNRMIHCESSLERLYVRLLDFDREVMQVESQPVCLLYSYKGKDRKYYPDFKVITSDGRVRLVEVKPKSKTQKPNNIIKFIIGRLYCDLRGWDYQIVSEAEIFRGYFQENLDIIRSFGFEFTNHNDLIYVLQTLRDTGGCTIEMLRFNCSRLDQGTFYKCIYKLIYHQKVFIDLFTEKLNDQSVVSIENGEEG